MNFALEMGVFAYGIYWELDIKFVKFQALLEDKIAIIDKNKETIISKVKQTASKLKFTLKGSAAKDNEFLQLALEVMATFLYALMTSLPLCSRHVTE